MPRVMSQESIAVVHLMLDAFNSEDIERVLALADPDFETEIPAYLSAEPDVYRGHDGMRRYFDAFREAMRSVRFESEGMWDAGADVVVLMRIIATGRATAIEVQQQSASVWTIRNGKVARIRMHKSPAAALAAVGLAQ